MYMGVARRVGSSVVGSRIGDVSVPSSVIRSSRFARFKNPSDVVAQVVALSRVDHVSAALWSDMAATITHSLPKCTGQDFATILKKYNGPRDEVMLAGICESIKYLPQFRLLRASDIAEILCGFHRFNFVPSVEVLNVIGEEVKRVLIQYPIRNIDLCRILRYFSILQMRSSLCVRFDEEFGHSDLVELLRNRVGQRIGSMTPGELAIITQYTPNISLEELMINFSRGENTPKRVEEYFLRKLDNRFGENAWKEFYYLIRPGAVDSTGWGRKQESEWDDDDDETELAVWKERGRKKDALLQLDEREVEGVLRGLGGREQPQAGVEPHILEQNSLLREKNSFTPGTISPEQLSFLAQFEEEMGMVKKPPTVVPFSDRQEKRIMRKRDRQDSRTKSISDSAKTRIQFKMKRNAKLFRFAILSHLVRNR